jgi:type VI secretion system protein
MVLTLEVVGQQASKLGASARHAFNGVGGTIGRLPDNDWVLPDPYISSRHARVEYRDGTYYLVDTSTNGVFLNSTDQRLARSQPYPLNNGDRIFIDAYEIRVTLAGSAGAPASGPSPLGDLFGSNAVPLSAPPPSSSASGRHAAPIIPANEPFISGDPFGPVAGAGPLGGSPPRAVIPPGPFVDSPLGEFGAAPESNADMDPLKLLGLGSPAPVPSGPRAEDLARRSPLSDHYVPPAPIAPPRPAAPPSAASGSAIPDDYDPLSDSAASSGRNIKPAMPPPPPPPTGVARPTPGGRQAAQPRPQAAPPAKPAAPPPRPPQPAQPSWQNTAAQVSVHTNAGRPSPPPPAPAPRPTDNATIATGKHLDLSALLTGAGLSDAQLTPELIENFGRILRVVVAGLMDVLRARERIKDEFRMRMTTFKAADNNPLKFSANVDDALHNLLVKRNAAYLGPVEAFDDAFNDVRNHQMAMLAGVRVAFEAMLAEFDPERLREQFDRQVKKGSLLAGPAKLRYWELYADRFRDMVNDREAAFRDLFGEEFARAYEEQLERLKAMSRANKK